MSEANVEVKVVKTLPVVCKDGSVWSGGKAVASYTLNEKERVSKLELSWNDMEDAVGEEQFQLFLLWAAGELLRDKANNNPKDTALAKLASQFSILGGFWKAPTEADTTKRILALTAEIKAAKVAGEIDRAKSLKEELSSLLGLDL